MVAPGEAGWGKSMAERDSLGEARKRETPDDMEEVKARERKGEGEARKREKPDDMEEVKARERKGESKGKKGKMVGDFFGEIREEEVF